MILFGAPVRPSEKWQMSPSAGLTRLMLWRTVERVRDMPPSCSTV